MLNDPWCIILNPVAGGGKADKDWPKVEKKLQDAGIKFTLFVTNARDHASELAMLSIQSGFRKIIGIGGDGTNSEICDGILRQTVVKSTEITYTLLPYGRGNDWARTYGFTNKAEDLIQRIKRGEAVMQDAGKAIYVTNKRSKNRYFVNVAGMAYDGHLVRMSENVRGGIQNSFYYQMMILRCLASYEAPAGQVRFNGKIVKDRFYLINVGICKYSGGGMQLVPHAKPNDGLLALTIAGDVPKWDVILQTPKFYTGTIGKHKQVQLHQSEMIQVEHTGDKPLLLEVDGEYIGTSPVRFEILSSALRILI